MNLFGSPNIEKMTRENDRDGLYRCLQHEDTLVRLKAAEALADLDDGIGWRYLFDAVRNTKDPEAQATAAAMLGDLGEPRAISVLGDVLPEARGEVADAIRDALEAIDDPEATEALRRAGYEPVIPSQVSGGTITEYEARYVRPVLPRTDGIHFLSAEEHLNKAVELREAELSERGLVEDTLAIWINPTWGYAWYLRGVLFEDLERSFEALLAYQRALELDTSLTEAREALNELEADPTLMHEEYDLLIHEVAERDWPTRRDAAAGLGDLAQRGDPQARGAVPYLIPLLKDDEREVRHAAVEALGYMDDRSAVLPLLEMNETSLLLRFSTLHTLARLGTVEGLVTLLRSSFESIQERNPMFSSQKDPLLEIEYDTLMEIGVRAFETTGDVEGLLFMAESNAWVEEDEVVEVEEAQAEVEGDEELGEEEEEFEPDEDLTSYVDEVAEMAVVALERLATPQLPNLRAETVERLAVVPDLTLLDITGHEEEAAEGAAVDEVPEGDVEEESELAKIDGAAETDLEEGEEEAPEPELVVVYDLSKLREAAQAELARRKG